jgi:cobyrinic acid a,c-diamide synthase
MFLAERLEDAEGALHPMVGVLPSVVRMRPKRMTLGYAAIELTTDTPLGRAPATARGHAFHFSTLDAVSDRVRRAYRVKTGDQTRAEGYLVGAALMSYVHLHFASNPSMAHAFVDACRAARR